jgi:hypothetical protein
MATSLDPKHVEIRLNGAISSAGGRLKIKDQVNLVYLVNLYGYIADPPQSAFAHIRDH